MNEDYRFPQTPPPPKPPGLGKKLLCAMLIAAVSAVVFGLIFSAIFFAGAKSYGRYMAKYMVKLMESRADNRTSELGPDRDTGSDSYGGEDGIYEIDPRILAPELPNEGAVPDEGTDINENTAYLGVVVLMGSADESGFGFPAGAFVREVTEGGGAEKAGILPYDVITEINGEGIENGEELVAAMGSYEPGDSIAVKLQRREGDEFVEKEFQVTATGKIDTEENDAEENASEKPDRDKGGAEKGNGGPSTSF